MVMCLAISVSPAVAQRRQASEYEIKAAYLYNFLLFTEWPEVKKADSDQQEAPTSDSTITIGILGDDPFGTDFAKIEGKTLKASKKQIVIKRLGRFSAEMDLKQCELLFICRSEEENLEKIIKAIGDAPVLTVSESKEFLEAGGMINLVLVKKKVRWEINRTPIELARLQVNSQLLRNAVRTVEIPRLPDKESRRKKKADE